MEATPRFVRRMVIVLVNDSGQSTLAALRYAMSLRPTMARAVPWSSTASRRSSFVPPGRQMLACRWSW